ncbi:hypothetical protein [Paractinoplanes toevensis]|uniref:Uncharacterized protein n=1 Tax=Paractinoplanes toevensis TaxID=571911 RepID=A0A919W0C8_9ACTN|nr:hypothetical protein [Actinoplanes toevensis]GIM89074.1 hypothetical protein Ato02nite_008670 [Actinoplanes toevensis]
MRASRPETAPRPLYARLLRLRHVAPSGFLCFVFLEGAVALGILLALAELVSWWGVLVLPLTVAVMVKLNDTIAGALSRPAPSSAAGFPQASPSLRPATVTGPAALGALDAAASRATPADLAGQSTTRLPGVINRDQGPPIMRPWAEEAEAHQQRVRQSASRRYE